TSTTVSSSSNPSVYTQNVTFTATISSQSPGTGTPTGTVLFQFDGHAYGGPVSVNSAGGIATASFNFAILAPGTHSVTATYNGDSNFGGSIGTLAGGQLVLLTARTPTSTTVSSAANPSSVGPIVTFTASVH